MEYYYCKEDKYNNIHSIDNVIITYFLTCTLDFALGHLKMISDCSSNYWEKLNVSRCSRYSYFNNIIHFDDGIYLKLGKYGMWLEDSKKFELLPKFQILISILKRIHLNVYLILLNITVHQVILISTIMLLIFLGSLLTIYRFFHHVKRRDFIRVQNTGASVIKTDIVKFMIRERNRR